MSETEVENYIPISEFAKIRQYSPRHIRRLIKQGKLDAIRIQEKGKWLVKKDQQVEIVRRIHKRKAEIVQREVSATELSIAKHWDELARTAEKFVTIWTQYLDTGTLIHGYIIDIDSHAFERFALENGYMAQRLLNHLKAEFPGEFEKITHWKDLLRDPLPEGCLSKLLLVAKRKTFEHTTCDLCQGWG